MRIDNPFTPYFDLTGALLDSGYIYVGVAGNDPQVSPVQVYWDAAFTIPATQPLRTRGGYVVNNGTPSLFFVNASDFSMRILDADSNLVAYQADAATSGATYQPLDSDLTAIASNGTGTTGLALLKAATVAAAKGVLGLGSYLSTGGGTMTGNILRSGAGPHVYHTDGTLTSGKIYHTAAGAADPTTQNGDIWLELGP